MARIRVMGAGGWGTALAMMADRSGHQVSMWSVFEEEVNRLSKVREHKKLLPGLSKRLKQRGGGWILICKNNKPYVETANPREEPDHE